MSWDTAERVDRGDDTRWMPEFSIPNGSELCNGNYMAGNCAGTAYFVKGLDKTQQMKEAEGGCSGLETKDYPLADLSSWVDPGLGTMPVVDVPPKVINGEVQTIE